MTLKSTVLQPGWVAAATFVLATASSSAWAYTPEQEQMCTNDAFRLCSSAIPDVDRVTACMVSKRDQLSPGCKVFFRESESEPVPTLVTSGAGKASAVQSRKSTRPGKPKKLLND